MLVEKFEKVSLPFAASVVNAPVERVPLPIGVPSIEPPEIAADAEAKLGDVSRPEPNVTGRLPIVFMKRLVAEPVSSTGFDAVREMLPRRVVPPLMSNVVAGVAVPRPRR